jgi:hypothetical protein
LTKHVATARGDYKNPLSEEEVRAKFRSTAGLALPASGVEQLEQAISRIADSPNLDEFAKLLVPQNGARHSHDGRGKA